jgi:CelD/BcsL family acetyltransferase involved in cellulose biosynthesis
MDTERYRSQQPKQARVARARVAQPGNPVGILPRRLDRGHRALSAVPLSVSDTNKRVESTQAGLRALATGTYFWHLHYTHIRFAQFDAVIFPALVFGLLEGPATLGVLSGCRRNRNLAAASWFLTYFLAF